MTVVSFFLAVFLVCLVIWLVLQAPIPDLLKKVIVVGAAFFLILWMLQALGVHTGFPPIRLLR